MENLRSLIRELLREELKHFKAEDNLKTKQVKEEKVSIQTSTDLNDFAKRLVGMSDDAKLKSDIIHGKHIFSLAEQNYGQIEAFKPISPNTNKPKRVQFKGGIITLRDIDSLSQETTILLIGKLANCTPLATDEIRRRKITIEREVT